MQTSGSQEFIDKKIVHPGDVVETYIKMLSAEYFAGSLSEGVEFIVLEGSRIVGLGTVTKIINEKLRK